MSQITKPMLAGKVEDMAKIKYPVYCTPKLDGIRCLKVDGKAVSRNFKPIPNTHIREFIEENFPDGVDGEIMIDGASFQRITSAVMSEDGEPEFIYCVFDYVNSLSDDYIKRMTQLGNLSSALLRVKGGMKNYKSLQPVRVNNEEELLTYEQFCLSQGYEGIMLRSPDGPYKCGRSTEKEGYLLKLKRFEDAEAWVTGFEERMHNANEQKRDAFGHAERSSHKANMVPTGMLGALVVDKGDGVVFKIGTGFTEEQRKEIWNNRHKYMSKLVKFKSQPTGVKEAPRFPVFLGWRHENDL